MTVRQSFSILLSLALTSSAFGGAWGTGAFENDDASDWVWELEESSGRSVIEAALRSVVSSRGYIEAPSGSYAIAAAETLAAMLGKPTESTPPEVLSWAKSQSFEPSSELLAMARTALSNVVDEDRSELAQLWSEAGPDYETWKRDVALLAGRLE